MNKVRKIADIGLLGAAFTLRQYLGAKAYILLLSVFIGILSGCAAVLLKKITHACQAGASLLAADWGVFLAPLLPVAGIFLCVALVKLFRRDKGYDKSLAGVISATANGTSEVPLYHTFSHIVTSSIAVGLGGSAGLEAPIALTGSAIGSNVGKFLRTGSGTRMLLLACGGAAGISAIFNSPVAGALFACEILLPAFSVPALIPLLMASAAAAVVSEMLGEYHPFIELSTSWNFMNVPLYVLLGIAAGLVSAYTIRVSVLLGKKFASFRNVYGKALCGSALIYLTFLVLPGLSGEGYRFTAALIRGEESCVFANSPIAFLTENPWIFLVICGLLVFMKPIISTVNIESGGDGGIFAPSMFIGAFTGFCVARAFNLLFPLLGMGYHLSEVNFLAVGMGGVLAGVMHAPMTGIFLIAEMTGGYKLFVPLMIVAALSSFLSRKLVKYNVYKSAIAVRGGMPEPNQTSVLMEKADIRELVENDFPVLKPEDTLRTILKNVMQSRRSQFPVLDENGMIVGIIRLEDVRKVLLEEDLYDVVLAYDIMRETGPVLNEYDTIGSATRIFESYHHWHLPVTVNGKYIGFISKSGLFDKYRDMLRNKQELF